MESMTDANASETYEALCEVVLGERRILKGHVGPREDFGDQIRDLVLLGLVRPTEAHEPQPVG